MADASDRRHLERILQALGYEVDRHTGASGDVWKHPSGLILAVHASPSDVRWLANQIGILRRRHPDHPVFERRKASTGARARRRRRNRQRQGALRVVSPVGAVKPPPVVRPNQTACAGCGRPWRSEIDPTGRPCPACGGEVVIGRKETRDFRWRLAA